MFHTPLLVLAARLAHRRLPGRWGCGVGQWYEWRRSERRHGSSVLIYETVDSSGMVWGWAKAWLETMALFYVALLDIC